MDVYYHVKFHLFIANGLKVSRGVQNCTHTLNRMCSDPPGIGLRFFNGLQVNGGRGSSTASLFQFTTSLIFRDFYDVLKHPFRYVHLFLLLTLSINRHARPVTEDQKLRCYTSH